MYKPKNYILLLIIIVLLNFHSVSAQSRYELSESQDGVLIGLGIPVAMFSFSLDLAVDSLSENMINTARRENVNRFDRFASYFYSENAALWSDILVYSCIAAPLILLIPEKMHSFVSTSSYITIGRYFCGLYMNSLTITKDIVHP